MYNSNDKKSSPTSYRLSTINRSSMYTDMEKLILIYTCISNPLHTYILSRLLISWEKSILSCNFLREYDIYCIRQFSTPGCRSVVSGLKKSGWGTGELRLHTSQRMQKTFDLWRFLFVARFEFFIWIFSPYQHHVIPYHTIPYHIILNHIVPCHIKPCHIISYHTRSYHAIIYHIMQYHILTYHAIL